MKMMMIFLTISLAILNESSEAIKKSYWEGPSFSPAISPSEEGPSSSPAISPSEEEEYYSSYLLMIMMNNMKNTRLNHHLRKMIKKNKSRVEFEEENVRIE